MRGVALVVEGVLKRGSWYALASCFHASFYSTNWVEAAFRKMHAGIALHDGPPIYTEDFWRTGQLD